MNERDWETDFSGGYDGCYANICKMCINIFYGHKHRWICRVCELGGKMERMVAPVRDALDPVVRNIDLGDE